MTRPRIPSDRWFQSLVRHSRDGIIVVDSTGTVVEWNDGEEAITGVPREQALGEPIWAVQHRLSPEELRTQEHLRMRRERALKGLSEGRQLRRNLEEEIRRPDGQRRIVQSLLFAIDDEGESFAAAICRDVTERKRLEEDLHERQALLLEAEIIAHLGHWARDLRTGESFWSDEVFRVLGYAPGSITPGREALLRAIVPQDRARVDQATQATRRDGVTRREEFTVLAPGGGSRHLSATVALLRDAAGTPARIIGTVQDVTERKQAEEALRRSQLDLRHAQAVAQVGSWRLDVQRNALEWSEETHRMFGVPPGTPLSYETFLSAVHPEDRSRVDEAWKAALGGAPYDVEHRIVVGTELRWVHERARLELGPDGSLLGGFGTVQDVTERKALEQALADANRRKDEFLAVLSHELRNPLAPVRSSLYVLAHTDPASAQAKRMLAIIERQFSHLNRLVDDLLDVTRISRGKIQLQRVHLELGELVRRAVEDHRSTFATAGVHLEGRVTSSPMWLQADATRIAQIIDNLLGNAAKFTPSGGRVDVTLDREGELGVLRVRDSGVGISADMLGRVFEPFTQADRTLDRARGGLGLGLALVKGLVELHGGSVAAESDGTGQGAQFTVRLPLEAERAAGRGVAPPAANPLEPRRVLIIEDNADAAESLKEALEFDGHVVELAHAGPEGLSKARGFEPDVVLCDIGLPGMDGYEVARAMRADEALARCTLVALTGYALPEDLQRARQAGFDRHLAKPPSFERLEEVLAEAPTRPPPAR